MRPRKFEEVSKDIEGRILSGKLKPGDALPSQARLCETFSVSRSCAQKALDELAAKGLIESQPGKGAFVRGAQAKTDFARRFKNIAVVFHQEFRLETDPEDNFGLEMLWGVEEELRKLGANCIIRKQNRNDSFERIVPELEAIGADAFIMDREFSDAQLRPLRALGVPVAVLGRLSSLSFVSSSLPNHADSFLQLFARMAEEGCRSVALVHQGGHYYDPELVWAFEQASSRNPETKFQRAELSCPFNSADSGISGTLDALFSEGRPEVLVFANDWHAVKALELLAKRKIKVPEELEVVGCFGIDLGAKTDPSLSSMALDPREIGRRAVRLISSSALYDSKPGIEKVAFSLIERDSFKWKTQGDIS